METPRILLADDDALLRLDLRALLEERNYKVVGEAEDGCRAIELARELKPSVTLLDVKMPGSDGIEVAGIIAKERLGAVVMLTGYSDSNIVERAISAGVLGFLVKPFRGPEIQPCLNLAIARYKEMTALEQAFEGTRADMEQDRLARKAVRVLMGREDLDEREALRRIQAQSLSTGRPVTRICEAIILSDEVTAQNK